MGGRLTDRSAPSVLSLDGVSHVFGDVAVLKEVSLQLPPETLVAVVGPNGSGKTTLLRIVTGLVSPSSGTVERPEAGQRPIGYLPQQPTLREPMTVRETIDFYRTLLNGSGDSDAVLEMTGLDGVPDRRVDALSGGMRQLLGIGLATLGDPPLVVLDEPTGSLDPRNTEHIFDIAAGLAEGGTSVLLSTHKLEYLTDADRILVLDDGQIRVSTSPEDLLAETDERTLTDAFNAILGSGPTVQTGLGEER